MKKGLKTTVKIALLGAIGAVLMTYLAFPIPFMPTFLKFDFSNITALLAAFALNPFAGFCVVLLKNVLRLLVVGFGPDLGVGEFADVLITSAIVFTAGILYQRNKSKKGAVIAVTVGAVVMSIVGTLANYFIMLPAYQYIAGFPLDTIIKMGSKVNPLISNLNSLIFFGILPFNIIKSAILSIIMILIYKKLSPILKK